MPTVFISYRREDVPHVASRLAERLRSDFGRRRVFFDIDSIGGGRPIRSSILTAIAESDAVLVIVGSSWGADRLAQADDYVRLELQAALDASALVIPVVVDGAPLPDLDALPSELAGLAALNALPLRRDPDFDADVARIRRAIGAHRSGRREPTWQRNRRRILALLGGFLLLSLAVGLLLQRGDGPEVRSLPASTVPPATTGSPVTTTIPTTTGPPETTTIPTTTGPPETTTIPTTTEPPETTMPPPDFPVFQGWVGNLIGVETSRALAAAEPGTVIELDLFISDAGESRVELDCSGTGPRCRFARWAYECDDDVVVSELVDLEGFRSYCWDANVGISVDPGPDGDDGWTYSRATISLSGFFAVDERLCMQGVCATTVRRLTAEQVEALRR